MSQSAKDSWLGSPSRVIVARTGDTHVEDRNGNPLENETQAEDRIWRGKTQRVGVSRRWECSPVLGASWRVCKIRTEHSQ